MTTTQHLVRLSNVIGRLMKHTKADIKGCPTWKDPEDYIGRHRLSCYWGSRQTADGKPFRINLKGGAFHDCE